MKISELKKRISQWPDDMDIDYENPNFPGKGEDLDHTDIWYDDEAKQLLIRTPFWVPVESQE